MIRSSAVCFILSLFGPAVQAQDIEIHSEFQRYNPFGRVVRPDHDDSPREILSPAIPRNGHLTVQIVVTGPPSTNYFLYVGTNPPDAVKFTVYRQHFVSCGSDYCPDWLTEVRLPAFGAIPESVSLMPGQTSRSYVLDMYVPPEIPPRRVRIEALLKTGIWNVAPMEVRVIEPTVPRTDGSLQTENTAPLNEAASVTAHRQFLRFMSGAPPQFPRGILRLSDLIQRNAAEDALLARQIPRDTPELNLIQWTPFVFPQTGAEWYLRVRDMIYRYKR